MALVGGRRCLGRYCGPPASEWLVAEEVLLSLGSAAWRPAACVGGAHVRTGLGQVSGGLLPPLLGHVGGTACRQASQDSRGSHSLSPWFHGVAQPQAAVSAGWVSSPAVCSRLPSVMQSYPPALWLATVPKHLGRLPPPPPTPGAGCDGLEQPWVGVCRPPAWPRPSAEAALG